MKNTFKTITVLFLSLFIASCSKEDDNINETEPDKTVKENVNEERFSKLEIGSTQLTIPQSGGDTHVNFNYQGKKKVTKITFDVTPIEIKSVGKNEFKWEVSDHLVPTKYYENQLNPNVHYHLAYKETETNPEARPAQGTYKFKITVEEEDGTKSMITKTVTVALKFKNLEVGENGIVALGSEDVHIEYEYLSAPNTVSKITHKIWFKEWRENQDVEIGKWNSIEADIDKTKFEGVKNPEIHSHFDLIENSPSGTYWAVIYVTETGNTEPIKTGVKFEIK